MKVIKEFIKLLVAVMAVLIPMQGKIKEAEAAEKYITVEDYIKYIVEQMNWQVDDTSDNPYIDVAIEKGILKEGDFKDYSEYLTRTDAAVIANRLDELIHQKYGYPEDVYDFLKDCILFKNILYYNADGKFYPKGATRKTYPEERFNEEVVRPILGTNLKNDKELRTLYYYVKDRDGNILRRYMQIGQARVNTLMSIDPLDENSEIIKAWNIIIDADRKVSAVLEKRISDIKDIPKNKREAVAAIVAKGIIKGYSNGMYVQNREFRGKNKITANGAKDVIQKVLHPDKRALISPDGQLIRTTNLPKNAKNYPYILECFPNEFYEMKYSFMFLTDYINGKIKKDDYAYPSEVDYGYLYNKFYHYQMNFETGKYDLYDDALAKAEKYLHYIFNVDYRTVDDIWRDEVASTLTNHQVDKRIYGWIDEYIKEMKKNQVIVKSEKISIEPSTIYFSRGVLYVRVYVKYKITAKDLNVSPDQLIYNSTRLTDLKNGQWRYGYYDVMLDSSYNIWGVSTVYSISDFLYDKSFK